MIVVTRLEEGIKLTITGTLMQFISADIKRALVTMGEWNNHKMAAEMTNSKFDVENYPNARGLGGDEELTLRREERENSKKNLSCRDEACRILRGIRLGILDDTVARDLKLSVCSSVVLFLLDRFESSPQSCFECEGLVLA